ncbi:hypothetical protein E4P24_18840 [Haloferax sp. AS1]|uniref:hypothetical protein n=1 Tax=Haloferax sp. AS1 TaxID=2562277 RepID=UPI00165F6CA2|nr:hypothetical protein [Haloferax sp. AS1]MBC9988403.1 hypothetical protein [Haloferax sp. AS1]
MSGSPLGAEPEDRDRGILTPDDRTYLRGEKEYSSEQSEIDARYRIRKRIKDSILDFSVILSNLSQKDREQVFRSNAPQQDSGGETSLSDFEEFIKKTRFVKGIENAIAFLYLGISDLDWDFEEVVEAGVRSAEEKHGKVVENVSVSIHIDYSEPDFEELMLKLESGEGLTRDEMSALIRSNEFEIDQATLDQFLKQFEDDISEEIEDGDIEIHFNDEE